MQRTIKGKDEIVEQVIVCLAAGGHVLIEDLLGLGKTTLTAHGRVGITRP